MFTAMPDSRRFALAFKSAGFVLASGLLAATARAQTPGTTATNPFPGGIAAGPTIAINDVAVVPNSAGAKPRLNSAANSPDGRLFVVDQRGPAYSISGGSAVPYLDVSTLGLGFKFDTTEIGFSTLAFHPQFTQVGTPGYGKLYAAFSTAAGGTPDSAASGRDHDEVVYELSTNTPLSATFNASAVPREVLRIARPNSNHNGGQLGFNPNAAAGNADYGMLYVGAGDSGGGGDPQQLAQNNGVLMGKVLRINPLGTGGGTTGTKYGIPADNAFAADGNSATRGEIYATGFRNPQRFSWDTGGAKKLFLGDVGQGRIEEVDTITNGANYGWGAREGRFQYIDTGTVAYPPSPDNSLYTLPIAEYDHDEGSAVSGGFVYRGTQIPQLTGKYVFGDLVNGRVFYVDATETFGGQNALAELKFSEAGSAAKTLLQLINETAGVSASRADLRIGQDAAGNLYLLNKQDGIVRVLVPEPAIAAGVVGLTALMRRRRKI